MSAPPKTGKGKKKGKEQTKISIEEFNKVDAPVGHSIVSIAGLDWAATMAEHDSIKQTDKTIILPQAPRALRAPNLDPDQLPKEPPFRVVLNNLPFGANEQDITERFFKDIGVKHVEMDRSGATVELESFQDLYDALCKSGASLKNKEVNVSLHGSPGAYGRPGDRYRQGERSGGFRNAMGGGFGGTDEPDRTDSDWRSAARPTPTTQVYNNDRMSGQRSQYGSRRSYDIENRNKYEGRSSYPERPGLVSNSYDRGDDRFNRHRMMNDRQPERDFANVRREARPITNDRNSNYPISIDEPRSLTPQSSSQNRPLLDDPNSEPLLRRSEAPRRQPLNLQKRTRPIEPVSEASSRNPAIFGEAKPVDTAARLREIEEKLQATSVGPDQPDKPASAPRSRRVSEAVSETAKE